MTWFFGLFKSALSGVWGYVAAAGTALVAILAIYRSGKSSGQNEVIIKTQEKEIENVKTARKVEQNIAVTKPDARLEQLHKHWTRD